MTENAFYPLFLLAAYLLVADARAADAAAPGRAARRVRPVLCDAGPGGRAVRRRARRRRCCTGSIERDLRERLRRFATLYGITAVGAVLARRGDARPRPLAADAPRRLPRRDRQRLLVLRGRPLPPLARRGARPLRRRDRLRGAVRAVARPAQQYGERPRIRCRDAADHAPARRGGGRVRVASVVPHRGAQRLLRRAVRDHRAVRPRDEPSSRASPGRSSRLRSPPASCPSPSRSRGSSTRRRCRTRSGCSHGGGCRTRGSTSARCGSSRSAAASPQRRHSCSSRAGMRWCSLRSSRCSSCSRRPSSRTGGTGSGRRPPAASGPASACRIRTGSTAGSAVAPTSRSSGTTPARRARSGTTSSSTAASARCTPSTAPIPLTAACPRRPVHEAPTARSRTAAGAAPRVRIRRLVRRHRRQAARARRRHRA